MNPELRQTLNTVSRNLQSANEAAQENIYTFTQLYIDPCLAGFKECVFDYTQPCFGYREERLRRNRGRSRGRAELNFDFYEDWENEEDARALGWGNDELDSLLAGSQRGRDAQPRRQRTMNYGTRGRKPTTLPHNTEDDPTIIPTSRYFGFLESMPQIFGGKGVRYQPSAADLQENPGGVRIRDAEAEPLLEESEEDEDSQPKARKHGRNRSDTVGSRSTQNSLSSRGDLIPSDEEADAIEINDEFELTLAKRNTNISMEEGGSGRSSNKRPGVSRQSTRTVSSKSSRSIGKASKSSSQKTSSALESQSEVQVLSTSTTEPVASDRKEAISPPSVKPTTAVMDTKSESSSDKDIVIDSTPMSRIHDAPEIAMVERVRSPNRPADPKPP